MEALARARRATPAGQPTATVLRSPSTNHPRVHGVHIATFDATGVLAPACTSATSRRDIIAATRNRIPHYRDSTAAVTCEKTGCATDNAGATGDEPVRPATAAAPCR